MIQNMLYCSDEMLVDLHQHLWSEPLIEALARRSALPFVRRERGLTVLHMVGDRPYVIDLQAEDPARRAALVREDGIDRALVCLSSPIGIEALPRDEAQELLDAYHEGALALPREFGVWGAVALERNDPEDVDRLLDRGCIGISLPAGALIGVEALARVEPLLDRLERRGAPLLVHPGPAPWWRPLEISLADPLWWPALTGYVADMQAAWLTFATAARRMHRELRVVFAMLAGTAPLLRERLAARGGPDAAASGDRLSFYDTSSFGPAALEAMARCVGAEQLVYGSDRPVLDPSAAEPSSLSPSTASRERRALAANAGRLLEPLAVAA
jgi:predicted TIM-barrel fold metal-dependent hydrolase